MTRKAMVLLASITLLCIGGSSTSMAASQTHNWTPVFFNFSFQCNDGAFSGTSLKLCIPLISGGLPFAYQKTGATVQVTLFLPKGLRIIKSRIDSGASKGWVAPYKATYADLHYRLLKTTAGVVRPVWQFRHMNQGIIPNWRLTFSVPAGMSKVCLGMTAAFPSVRSIPAQHAQECYTRQG